MLIALRSSTCKSGNSDIASLLAEYTDAPASLTIIYSTGFDDDFMVPQSRHTTVKREDIEAVAGLKILSSSERAGVYAKGSDGRKEPI